MGFNIWDIKLNKKIFFGANAIFWVSFRCLFPDLIALLSFWDGVHWEWGYGYTLKKIHIPFSLLQVIQQ